MNSYVDYEFYITQYYGKLEQDDFSRAVIKASAHVRKITFGRADEYTEDDSVKFATCAICDVIAAHEKRLEIHNGMDVTSENTDGYIVAYAQERSSGESLEELLNRKIYQAAEVYLLPTGLLNWGINDADEW